MFIIFNVNPDGAGRFQKIVRIDLVKHWRLADPNCRMCFCLKFRHHNHLVYA